jgi:putative tryptophan/tyrosine transport system substrate-binding protein
VRRREVITLLGGAAAAWPLVARAQQREQVRRIGVLLVSGPELMGSFPEALRILVMSRAGTSRSRFDRRKASSLAFANWLPNWFAVDVIVATQTPAVYAAKNATRDIPIVMMAVDPIATYYGPWFQIITAAVQSLGLAEPLTGRQLA